MTPTPVAYVMPRVWIGGAPNHLAHVFVLSSVLEGMSNSLREAMAAGRPVVATRVGGNPEVVAEGAARRRVESQFTPERMVYRMEDPYDDLLAGKRAA